MCLSVSGEGDLRVKVLPVSQLLIKVLFNYRLVLRIPIFRSLVMCLNSLTLASLKGK